MKLEYEIVDDKHIRFNNNRFKVNILLLPILGTGVILSCFLLVIGFLITIKNIFFLILAAILIFYLANLGISYFKVYKEIKKK